MQYTCLSVRQPYATGIVEGLKTIEVRKWTTKYRGTLLICSTVGDAVIEETGEILPGGYALGTVELVDVRPLEPQDCEDAWLDDWQPGLYAWILKNPRSIKPIPIKGQQRLFHREIEPIFID